MKRIVISACFLVTFPAVTLASDVAMVMATMKDVQASCRYLMELCRYAKDAQDMAKPIYRTSEEMMKRPTPTDPDSPEFIAQKQALTKSQAMYAVEQQAKAKVAEASQVLRAKHPKARCLGECTIMLLPDEARQKVDDARRK